MSITSIIINIIILCIRLWMLNNVLNIFKHKKKIIALNLIYGISGVIIISIYPKILELLQAKSLIENGATRIMIAAFLVYLIIRTLILTIARNKATLKTLLIYFVYTTLALSIASIAYQRWGMQGATTSAIFFLLIATGEERVKLSNAQTSFQKYHINTSDIILFGILTALGFSFFENIILTFDIGTALIRMPMYLVHIIFTSIACYSIYLVQEKQKSQRTILVGIATAIWLHTRYNFSNIKIHFIGIIILGLVSYYIFSFLLYKSDSIYMAIPKLKGQYSTKVKVTV